MTAYDPEETPGQKQRVFSLLAPVQKPTIQEVQSRWSLDDVLASLQGESLAEASALQPALAVRSQRAVASPAPGYLAPRAHNQFWVAEQGRTYKSKAIYRRNPCYKLALGYKITRRLRRAAS